MTTLTPHKENAHIVAQSKEAKALFGFWIYIMSDALLFGSIFAVYAVLRNNVFGGPSASDLFSMPFVLTETLILLAGSFTYGLASLYAHHRNAKSKVLLWLGVTFLLGVTFIAMEVSEFTKIVEYGNSWQRSGFLSSFFTLVGTHGLHVTAGLIWMAGLIIQVWRRGVNVTTIGKVATLGLFWHFLYIVWIFIFTFVYLMGVI